jgi:serine/threonine-protein kinase
MKENSTDPIGVLSESDDSLNLRDRQTVVGATPTGDSVESTQYSDIAIGAQIGNYRVEQALGQGGFGSVYKAHDSRLGRHVALKFLKPTQETRHQQLFEREAKAIAQLNKHPNIVKIFEYGEFKGQSYFALEYVPLNAAELLKRNPRGLLLHTAISLMAECADALAFAHEHGVIHRDIKPANILLESETGPVKVADFGLSRLHEVSEGTITGTMSGTPPYMSPEQARGIPVDSRTDVYSLGVTLYEFLSGERPFVGSTMLEVIDKILEDHPIPLRKRRDDLPDAVYRIVDKATEHSPSDRYQAAADMARELRAVLQTLSRPEAEPGPSAMPRPAARRKTRATPVRLSVAGILVALGIAAAVFVFSPAPSPSPHALAKAVNLLESNRLPEAEVAFRETLKGSPADSQAQLGLGQVLFRLGKMSEAKQVFQGIDRANLSEPGIVNAYVKLIAAQLDQEKRTEVTAAIKRLQTLIESEASAQGPEDEWTSRPLTFFVLPSEPGTSRFALRSGLLDVMPSLLGEALDETTPMNLVDRELINDIVTELQISGQLGSQTDQLRLGKVLGARFILRVEFNRIMDTEVLHPKVVDTETGERIVVKQIDLTPKTGARALVDELARGIWTAVEKNYPIRGVLKEENGQSSINVGTSEGVKAGIRFAVALKPDQTPLPDRFIVVEDPIGPDSAAVRLENLTIESIPKEGMFVSRVPVQESSQ